MNNLARWMKGTAVLVAGFVALGVVAAGCGPEIAAVALTDKGGGSSATAPPAATGVAPAIVFTNKNSLNSSRGRSGFIGINYQVTDKEKHSAQVLVEHSTNGGVDGSFKRAQVRHSTANNNPGRAAGSGDTIYGGSQVVEIDTVVDLKDALAVFSEWDSAADLGLGKVSNVVLKVTVFDVNGAGNSEMSVAFTVDNAGSAKPLVGPEVTWPQTATDPNSQFAGAAWTGVHAISFRSRDLAARPLSLTIEYSSSATRAANPSNGWKNCTAATDNIQVGTSNLKSANDPFGVLHPNANLGAGEQTGFRWQSDLDVTSNDTAVQLRLTPRVTADPNIVGEALTSPFFTVNKPVPPPSANNTRPIVNITQVGGQTTYAGQTFSGTIPVTFTVKDNDGDNVSVTGEYSIDSGATWKAATPPSMTGLTTKPAGTAVVYTYQWDSTKGITGVQPNVLFRLTVSDTSLGNAATSAAFNVNNSAGGGGCDVNAVNANASFTLVTPAQTPNNTTAVTVTTSPTLTYKVGEPASAKCNILWVWSDATANPATYFIASQHALSPEGQTCLTTTPDPGTQHVWQWDAEKDIKAKLPSANLQNGQSVWLYPFHPQATYTGGAALPTSGMYKNTPLGPYLLNVKDSNQAPTITVTAPAKGATVAYVPATDVTFQVADADGDQVNVQFQYWNGTTWATMTEGTPKLTQPMAPGTYTFKWDVGKDLPAPPPSPAFIQLIPTDVKGKAGAASTQVNGYDEVGAKADSTDSFSFVTNQRPVITLDSPNKPVVYPTGQTYFSGDVTIKFTVYDAESDAVTVKFEYWDNSAFKPMTIKSVTPVEGSISANTVVGLTPGASPGKQYTAIWDSKTDIPADLNIFITLTPSDAGGAGTPAQSGEQTRVKNDGTTGGPGGGPPTGGTNTNVRPANNGNGTFGSSKSSTTGAQNRGLTAADVTGDGSDDLAVADMSTSEVVLMESKKDGTFVTKGRYVVGFNGSSFNTNAYHCVAADFNGDLWLDVAAIAAAAFDVTILYNLGNGSFQAGTNYLTMSQTGYNSGAFTPFDMELGDANGDQKPDVYVLNTTQNHDYSEVVGVLTNTGNGLLNPAVMSDPGIAWQASIGVGDWNGDTKDDCIIGQLPSASDKLVQPMVSDGTTGKMTLYGPGLYIPDLPNGAGGSGGFSGTQIFNCLFNPSACISQMLASAFGASTNDMGVFDFASGDYDADGDEDVAAPMAPGSPNGNDGAVGIFVNNGNTSFEAPKNKSYMTAVGANPFGIVSGFVKKSGRNTWGRSLDLNADGQPDIAVSANLAKAVSVCVRDTTQAMTASGNYKRTDYPVGIECWFIAGGDFNNDGKYDIATSERVSSTSAGGPGIAVVMGN